MCMGLTIHLTKIIIMNFETDYLANKIEDKELRDLLIKSRKRNADGSRTIYPVEYNGRTYWNIEHLVNEESTKMSNDTIKKVAIYFCIGAFIYILGMYNIASLMMH